MNEQSQHIARQIPEFLHVMEVALRSGYSLSQSLEMVTQDMHGAMAAEIQHVLRDVEVGRPLPEALDAWLARCPSLDLDLVIATIHAQMETGGNLANKFQFIAQVLPKLKRDFISLSAPSENPGFSN